MMKMLRSLTHQVVWWKKFSKVKQQSDDQQLSKPKSTHLSQLSGRSRPSSITRTPKMPEKSQHQAFHNVSQGKTAHENTTRAKVSDNAHNTQEPQSEKNVSPESTLSPTISKGFKGKSPKERGAREKRGQEKRTTAITRFIKYQADEFKSSTTTSLNCSPKQKQKQQRGYSASILFFLSVTSLTSAIGYRFYNDPKLDVGTIAPITLHAPESARIEDTLTTQAKRDAASQGFIPVLMLDEAVNQRIYQSLDRSLKYANALREEAGAFPYFDTAIVSTRVQNYLRQIPEAEWKTLLSTVDEKLVRKAVRDGIIPRRNSTILEDLTIENLVSDEIESEQPLTPLLSKDIDDIQVPLDSTQALRQIAIIELQAYRQTASDEDFSVFTQLIIRSRQNYRIAVNSLNSAPIQKPTKFYTEALLELSDDEWKQTSEGIHRVLERVLLQGVANGTPETVTRKSIEFDIERYVPESAIGLTTNVLMGVIKPNLIKDEWKTQQLAEQAALAVQPEIVEISRAEVIVNAGDVIKQTDFVLLDHFDMSRRGINWFDLVGFATLTSGGVALFLFAEYRFRPKLRSRDHVLVLLLSLTVPLTVALSIPAPNLPLVGLLVGSFYGSALGITVIGVLGIILPIGMNIPVKVLVASIIGSLVGTVMAERLRSREELALLGGTVGLAQGVVYLIISLILSATTGPLLQTLLAPTLTQALMGVAWSIVALGISPYLEHLFDLVTPIRLVELSNPNRPLLKRVASEAPGTFQHTLFVASLAEAAARDLRCNVELVRAGTLYHDIGKMHDPQGFIENQMGGGNKHDDINDPWVSAEIIKKHVTEGLVMARRCRLPGAIQAFIPEHQGTMLITYFYYQAQEQSKIDTSINIREEDFRYDGPIPQSRETGIVMLADSCEAALRSLKDASQEEALVMVNRILRARWQDNQMVDSGLTRQDMGRIAEIFVHVWQQYNHKRIPYPKAALSPKTTSVSS